MTAVRTLVTLGFATATEGDSCASRTTSYLSRDGDLDPGQSAGLNDAHRPCPALADFPTLREHFAHLAGLLVAYVGDGNNVAQILMGASSTGMDAASASQRTSSAWVRTTRALASG